MAKTARKSRPHKTPPKKTAPKAPRLRVAREPALETAGGGREEEYSANGAPEEHCISCGKTLHEDDQALFVEEEVGRIFCSEDCIVSYFSPEIERLENEFLKHRSDDDFDEKEREDLHSYKSKVLESPSEIWREKTVSGDFRYFMIGEFTLQKRPFWVVCVSLFLRGEPSFLYMTLITRDPKMIDLYRRGERVEWSPVNRPAWEKGDSPMAASNSAEDEPKTDRLAESFTEEETFRANLMSYRREDDIPLEEFELYQSCVEQTLQSPDEVWSWTANASQSLRVYHFMKAYPGPEGMVWFIIIARETTNPEQLEILDAFPTRDPAMVERFRVGEQEIGETTQSAQPSRTLH